MTLTDASTHLRRLTGITPEGPQLLPLDAGEQYRFSFAMDACIGCHSCEVACAEQNGNPVDVSWRRVGEIEGGSFPHTRRFNLSMACNHCLEPTCLAGCPTNAYVKLDNGIVKHNAEDCVGCQYCIWNCPYEVPVFNPQRRIVTKCDMCLPRLELGQLPACVLACPTQAISVEKVNIAQWRADHAQADAPGLPSADITLSTTRIQLPANVPVATFASHEHRLAPADPHWPLVALTLLTQLAAGAVAASVALAGFAGGPHGGPGGRLAPAAIVAFVVAAAALGASLLHLGRPAHAWKAMRNLRRSWLSREVACFTAFSGASMVYALAALARWPVVPLGVASGVCGAAGIYTSGRLYLVPARPAWNSRRTLVAFFATALAGGPLLVVLVSDRAALPAAWVRGLLAVSAAGTMMQLVVYQHLAVSIARRKDREYRGTARLLFDDFGRLFTTRIAAGVAAVAVLVAAAAQPPSSATVLVLGALAFALTAYGELAGRYLFYVTVVPMTAAGSFFQSRT